MWCFKYGNYAEKQQTKISAPVENTLINKRKGVWRGNERAREGERTNKRSL